MDKALRNTLRNVVTQCRRLLEEAIGEILQGQFGIHRAGKVEDAARMGHLSDSDRAYREQVLVHLQHIESGGFKRADAVAQLIREVAFTHLNRLVAYKMLEQRKLIREAVSRGLKSNGFMFYLAEHEEDQARWSGGQQDIAYRHFLEWLGGTLSEEIGVLFSPHDPANRLFPPQRVLDQVLALINSDELKGIWSEDETIGWVYQYFTPKELRDKARKESATPRNSYEMAFRNQFFTPRYVVEFLVDNTLGRTWHEMRRGDTVLKDKCRYLVSGQSQEGSDSQSNNGQRAKKDPRQIKVLDPACGSGHFLLYCFELLQTIYEEAYADPELAPKLQRDFPNEEEFKREIPGLILAYNLHGIDIDLRVTQLAVLALWLRAQRAFQEMGLKENRPQITRMNLVCAEPMPGEEDLLEEFIAGLSPHILGGLIGNLVRNVFARIKLAGEAGALVRIEDDISGPIEEARRQWQEMLRRQAEREEKLAGEGALFDYRKEEAQQRFIFDIADITSEKVWQEAEEEALKALREYARRASNGRGLLRRLFAEDAEQGFAFIDLCRQKFDVVLMNPPFGDASLPSKPYIDETYGDTKGDVYKAFVECFQDRLVPGGFLGIISSRTGFFLSGSSDWRERIVLRLYRPLVLADFGMGVLDAMVETAAYVLRSLTSEEDEQLTLQLAQDLPQIPTDKNGIFSTKKYETTRGLKRHQANGELRRLYDAGFIKPVEGRFPRWMRLDGEIAKAPAPANAPYPSLVCLRLLGEDSKGQALYKALHNAEDPHRFSVSPEQFNQLRSKSFSYWLPRSIYNAFSRFPSVKDFFIVRSGSVTFDDFRFLRLLWEIPSFLQKSGNDLRWQSISKGGAFSEHYADVHLLIDWKDDGDFVAQCVYSHRPREGFGWGVKGRNVEYFGKPSVTWSRRSQKGFSARILPAGNVFSDKSPVVQSVSTDALWMFLGVSNTAIFRNFLQSQISFGSYEVGAIERSPLPLQSDNGLLTTTQTCFNIKRDLDTASETSHVFYIPSLLQASGNTLMERIAAWQSRVAAAEQQLAAHQQEIDDIAFRLYGISDEDRRAIETSITQTTLTADDEEQAEDDDETESDQPATDHRPLTTDLISYFVGCAFGRWDARFATGEQPAPELPDPFAPLPVCAPGALTGADGLPLHKTPPGYPLRVDWDSILMDDPDHEDDIIRRVREVFELLWQKRAEEIEREACDLLGIKTLRDYFRKPGNDGFWMQHVKRYSKSRRKAPIYWLLQSSKKSYAVWLYYHRLDKDILFKVLVNYVEPKMRLEETRLEQARSERAAGASGREARQLDRQIEKQETLLSELRDFHDKLRRAAALRLEPDLNDGVVLNIAPLWELVPWAEAKKYWQELLAGKYEWSSISRQLRERKLVKAG